MGLFERITGQIRAEVSGAFPESALNAAALSAIEITELESVDACTVRVSFAERDLPELEQIARKCMCELKVISAYGGSRTRKLAKRRKWLIIFALLTLALLMLSSLFIWEIDVRGNESLTEGELLRALADCGVGSGTFWPGLSADLVRSEMMTKLPEIGWMALNVCGSRAVLLIQERQEKPEIYAESGAADIIAAKTGIIKRVSVQNGKAAVSAGEAVTEGEILVSGTLDSISNGTRSVRAKARILAETWYELTAVCPAEEELKEPSAFSHSRFALIFGKRRINLYISSGKTIDECDKIIHEYKVGIEGVFALPVALVREELRSYESETGEAADIDGMEQRLRERLAAGVTGEIEQQSVTQGSADGLCAVTLRARCLEDIGETVLKN